MARASTISTRAAWALLAAVMAFSAWKAWSVPLTPDEARTFNDFASRGVEEIFGRYDANHHFLHTYLCAISIRVFGMSEFAVRLPALIAGAGYLIAVYMLARTLFGAGLLFLPAIALLSLNPIVLDNLSLARGYSLALWFLTLAICWMLDDRGRYERIGVILALMVASNLAFAFPAIALLALYLATLRSWSAIERVLLPGIVTGFVLMALPLSKVQRDSFYYGSPTFSGAVDSIVKQSFERADSLEGIGQAARWLGLAVLVAAGVALMAVVVRWARERWVFQSLPLFGRFLYLAGGGSLLTLAGLFAAHVGFGMVYPLVRTAIYFIPLMTLTALVLLNRRYAAIPAAVLAVVCVAQYAVQIDPDCYWEWKTTSGMPRVAARIRSVQTPGKIIDIKTSHALNETLNYYRTRYKWSDWSRVGLHPEENRPDFLVLADDDLTLVKQWNLKVLLVDRDSGLVLAR